MNIQEGIFYSDNTPSSAASDAQKKFGHMLDSGWKFVIGKTPGGAHRLQIKEGKKLLFEFNAGFKGGIPQKPELTEEKVQHAIDYIKKYVTKEINEMKHVKLFEDFVNGANSEETTSFSNHGLNEDFYPKSKGGDIEGSLRSEEIGRLNLKHKGDIIGTLLVWMRPEFVSYNNYDETKWEVGASYTAYPVSSGHSTGTGIWGAGKSFSKEEAIKAGKDFLKNIKLS